MISQFQISPVLEQSPDTDRAVKPTVCIPVHFHPLPGAPDNKISYTLLPFFRSLQTLKQDFTTAPQFRGIALETLLKDRRGRLQVLLLGESDYYTSQAALYLAAIARMEDDAHVQPDEEFLDMKELSICFDVDDTDSSPSLDNALLSVQADLLDPHLHSPDSVGPVLIHSSRPPETQRLASSAILVSASTGPVLSESVIQQLLSIPAPPDSLRQPDLFLSLRTEQVDLELLERLRFHYGFHVVQVGQPDQDYFRRFLEVSAEDLMTPISPAVDLDQVISGVRRYRGNQFDERDLEALLHWAIQRHASPPLQLKDLQFQRYQLERQGRKILEQMVGLTTVKDALRRMLAASVLDLRRRQAGKPSLPACRNLAFAGPPGTGKSVTARLVAQILREEGCGTGRFVEAGREQLIGVYLGQTSHLVAELFQKAKGGVLFVDEAGALLDNSGRDSYAAEAVNALVRHMELNPETIVIFATYPEEMERLLTSNPGLSSRVAQVLHFEGYSDQQLWQIMGVLAEQSGYQLPQQAESGCLTFFAQVRQRKGARFGNGREARRLFQAAVEELALRTLDRPDSVSILTVDDLSRAAQRLLDQERSSDPIPIGF